jgi:photosystem II stability/assembly factor-like uncharacterized protein
MPSTWLRSRRFLTLFAVFALSTLLPAPRLSAQPYTWTPTGPFGGTVANLAVHPNNPQVIYAGADHGIFRSTDAGSSWNLLPGSPGSPGFPAPGFSRFSGSPGPNFMALDTARPRVLYATGVVPPAQVQVFRSVDGGSSWRAVSRNLPSSIYPRAFAVEPSPASRLYIGTFGRGILRSTDGGVTWKKANQGLSSSARFVQLLVAPRKPSGTVFAGTRDGLYRTVDGGASWTRLNGGLPAPAQVSALTVSPSDPKTLYASLGSEIYRSTDGGTSWTPTTASSLGVTLESLAVHPRSPLTVYAGSFFAGGVFKSTDGGAHWTATALPPRIRVRTLALAPMPAATLYVGAAAPDPLLKGADPGGVFRSADGGASWTRVNQGLANLIARSAAIDPGNPDVLVAGMLSTGLSRTADRGTRWTRTNFGLPALQNFGVQTYKVLATAPGVFYAIETGSSGYRLWKSTDSGLTWDLLPNFGDFSVLLADPLETETLYAPTSEGLKRTTDGGASWVVVSNSFPPTCVFSEMAITRPSASQPASLWFVGSRRVVPADGSAPFCRAAVIRSLDLGSSWVEMDAGLPDESGKTVATIATDPRDPRTLYAGMGEGADGVWKSTDGGSSWQPAGLGGASITALAVSPVSGGLWARTQNKIYRSADGGATWQDRGRQPAFDLPGPNPVDILLDSTHRRVYAMGAGGVWVSEQEP